MVGVKKKIYFNHGVPCIGHKWLTRKILKIIEFLNCVLADQIITVSNDMLKELKSITNKKVDLIHNGSACGIDLNFIRKQSKSKFRHKFKFEKSDFLCVFIGRFEKRKGYNIVINVWKNHFKNNMKMKLLLYGGSPSKTKNNDNKSNIIYMGYTNNISEVLCGADCLFLPSYHEGLSYVALEAAILCCPIIANDIPGIRSVVDDKINGYLIKNNNEFEYFKILSNLQKKQLNKKDLQKKSNQLSKQFDRNIFLSEYIKYFHQI
jgi:glycosyltransferase involved in cell wall biosynthesis